MDRHIVGFRKSSIATKNSCHSEIPRIVLAVAAHPDDLDFGAGGTVAAWAASGAAVYYLILTNGNKGSAERSADPKALTEIRRAEQRAAARVLGVKNVLFLDYEDGMLACDTDVKRDIVRVIRRIRPGLVITTDPSLIYDIDHGFLNHPDHRAAGQATLDAVYPLARDPLTFPELADEGLEAHNVREILLTNHEKQNCYIDISDTFNTKLRAVQSYASQVAEMEEAARFITDTARELGIKTGVRYAEGFVRVEIRPGYT